MTRLFLDAADAADVEALAALERLCFTHPWSAVGFRQATSDPHRGAVVTLRVPWSDADPERGIRGYCAFQVVLDELHIHNLAIHPDLRRAGLGRWLVSRVVDFGVRRGARTALLEVRQSNWAALHLYRSVGFQAVSVRRDYYSRPREDALILRKDNLEISRGAC